MTREEYLVLFEKFLSGKATPEELELIMSYKDDFELIEPDFQEEEIAYLKSGKKISDQLYKSIHEINTRKKYTNLAIAASLILMIGFSSLFLLTKNDGPTQVIAKAEVKSDVKPGANKAILTLNDGKQIALTDGNLGTVLTSANIVVKKEKNGELQYHMLPNAPVGKNVKIEYNTISTPKGGQYQVVLPDGSKVWLNAASSLRFPTVFVGSERKVELQGEGYFEVAKNRNAPFKVEFNGQTVEVLGTHFNIKAYNDEDLSQTTLLEGSISITKNNIKKILVPGQQAMSLNDKNDLAITDANLEQAIAWKNNMFLFHNTNIKEIMKQIARWYDVDVYYAANLTGKEYGGRVSKFKNLSEILKNIELTGTIRFKIEGRRVTVME